MVESRAFPSEQQVWPGSACPNRNLVALASTAEASGYSNEGHKVQLWRNQGTSAAIWEFKPVIEGPAPSTAAPAQPTKPLPRLLGLKGKAKAATPASAAARLDDLTWSPSGEHLAVVYSAGGVTQLALLSLQDGKPVLPVKTIKHPVVTAHWIPMPKQKERDPELASARVIRTMPSLPPVSQGALSAGASNATGTAATTGFAGARAALLARRKAAAEEDQQRPLDFNASCSSFPCLIPNKTAHEDDESEPLFADDQTILCLASENGQLSLLLGGYVSLGTVQCPPGRVRQVIIDEARANKITLEVFFRVDSANKSASLVSNLRSMIDYAFKSVQEARSSWDESRRIAKAWMSRLNEVLTSHADQMPINSQLLSLLVVGRLSPGLHEFLASKMNEKAINKWEDATVLALAKVKDMAFHSLAGSMERVVVFLEELSRWKKGDEWLPNASFLALGLEKHVDDLLGCSKLGVRLVMAAYELTKLAQEEERCFGHVRRWLKFELDKMAQAEGSDIKPEANFHPIPVAYYIRQCLLDGRNDICPYLDFGLTSKDLESSDLINEVEQWLTEFDLKKPTPHVEPENDTDDAWERFRKREKGPKSICALLHLLAKKTGKVCDVITQIDTVSSGAEIELGMGAVTSLGTDGLRIATLTPDTLQLDIIGPSGVREAIGSAALRNANGLKLVPEHFDFLDHDHALVAARRSEPSAASTCALCVVPVRSLSTDASQPQPVLPVAQSVSFELGNLSKISVSRHRKHFTICAGSEDGRKMQSWVIDRHL